MKDVAYAFLGPFPKGNVSTVRILSYTKEIVGRGDKVTVYILAPTNEAKINDLKEGYYEGVNYKYLTKISWGSSKTCFVYKLLFYFIGVFKFFKIILSKKHDLVLSYHNEFCFNSFISLACRIVSIPFVLDITEYPRGYDRKTKSMSRISKLSLSNYDGIITVSNELSMFYDQIIEKKCFKLPITIDIDRYNSDVLSLERKNVITSVFGVHNRDCLINTLKVFNSYFELCKKSNVVPWNLQLIGDFKKLIKLHSDVREYYDEVKNREFFEYVAVLGQVDNLSFPKFICSSKILINTPQLFESGGFPTKLGEYLLSGVPVIYTAAGEIGELLSDKRELFLFEPGDIKLLSVCIYNIQRDYENANVVGQMGRETALRIFNAKNYIEDLLIYCYNENKR